jgi:hypothetical protein
MPGPEGRAFGRFPPLLEPICSGRRTAGRSSYIASDRRPSVIPYRVKDGVFVPDKKPGHARKRKLRYN